LKTITGGQRVQRIFTWILSIVIVVTSAVLCRKIILSSVSNQQNKLDCAEINHIKYGLFSVNEWKRQLAAMISEEITKLNLTDANEKQLKKHVEIQLNGLIDNVDKKIRESNKGTTKGWMKQSFINAFVDMEEIKKGIPEYADAIIIQMTEAKTEHHLKGLLKKRIGKYFDKTFEAQDLTRVNRILTRTATPDIESARAKLDHEIGIHQNLIFLQTWLLIALAVIIFAISGFSQRMIPAAQFIFLLLTLLMLLLAGITTPMIDMEAKISEMSFTLLDYPFKFVNQVLYFQSKSILDVFWIMITHVDLEMKLVGILMVTFSLIFPLVKMLASLGYYYNWRGSRESRWIQFFVLKSGKWSMADVLIVAIFMAYIGFNGIISSQFGNLKPADPEIVILSTNGTSLQPAFYIFLTYTVLALFLSGFLIRRPKISTGGEPASTLKPV
jgi:hypothetical protein